ncbi:nuclear transport factor 2 family protein [Lutibacter sp.]|uniref:nuclear transport factor 2 family protein n=1 Tax=Lutibacter sp. TaxID=1925666 RepID=UPI002735730B|nr:nuclear transport factor 2 family protein [Lutibacter sp.]MDP3313944.1 nuclear transport factor 2 family protein [Lutibacter sp.]
MKNLLLLGLVIVLSLSSCNQKQRYTQQSAEIDTYKKVMNDYKKMNWDDMPNYYADTAKIANNVITAKAITVAQAIEKNKDDAKLFTWVVEDIDYEMVVTDKGETWVNYWGIWRGTLKSSGKIYEIPFHNTAQFVDGKIVREDGYWDNSEIMVDLQKLPPPLPTETTVTK